MSLLNKGVHTFVIPFQIPYSMRETRSLRAPLIQPSMFCYDDIFLEPCILQVEFPKSLHHHVFVMSCKILDFKTSLIFWLSHLLPLDEACVANVKVRVNNDAAIVLAATLELSRHSETKLRIDNSVPQSINAIYDEVIKREGGLGMDLERIRASLDDLGCEAPLMEIDETYSVDLKNIIEQARIEEVESIVLKRYGREAYRMFRLLSKADRLVETDKISDTTFVEKKDAVKILFKLWKDDYLEMKKVIARAAKQSEFILWKINKQSLWEHILDEMYHAALNLRLRITHEKEQEKEILQMPKDKLVGELGNKYMRLRKVCIVLESSLMNLDDSLMLFHDF